MTIDEARAFAAQHSYKPMTKIQTDVFYGALLREYIAHPHQLANLHDTVEQQAKRIAELEEAITLADIWLEATELGFASSIRPDIAKADYMRASVALKGRSDE